MRRHSEGRRCLREIAAWLTEALVVPPERVELLMGVARRRLMSWSSRDDAHQSKGLAHLSSLTCVAPAV